MAYLLLDTRQTGSSAVWWMGERGMESWLLEARAQEVLGCIHQHMSQIQGELKGVAIVAGPGRFSSVRVGALYANLLARWFRVPLFEATPADVENEEGRQAFRHKLEMGTCPPQTYVAPIYDREPNITSPRV